MNKVINVSEPWFINIPCENGNKAYININYISSIIYNKDDDHTQIYLIGEPDSFYRIKGDYTQRIIQETTIL